MTLLRMLKRLLLATSAVTSLPVANLYEDPHALHGLSKYLPAVGSIIGSILCGLAYILVTWCHASALSIGVIVTIAWLVLSGGIHFDGLMDTADGVFSHRSPQRMLEIMQDSRVGNFGVLTGVAVVLIKVAGLVALNKNALLCGLILIPAWSRWCETFAIGRFTYLREQGLGKIWHDTTRFPLDAVLALVVPLAASAACACFFGERITFAFTLSTVAAGLFAAYYLKRILGGHTGDTYGAVVELSEAGALLMAMLLP